MADKNMLRVAPPPTEAEKIERMERVIIERVNARLVDEIAPAQRAELLAEMRSELADMRKEFTVSKAEARRTGRNEGRWQGMLMGAALVLGLMVFGYTAVTFNTAVAVRQGAAIAGAEAANNEIRQELDNR